MKTAISIPDDLFAIANSTAKSLGIPRSQLFVIALKEFLDKLSKKNITEKLNRIYQDTPAVDENLIEAGLQSMREATEYDTW